nr:probable serine/threonine-protein kinase clkA isoform X2 [Dermatophagoides farinae]
MSFKMQGYLKIIQDEAEKLREVKGVPRGRSNGDRNRNTKNYSNRNGDDRFKRNDSKYSYRDDDFANKWTSNSSGRGRNDYYNHCDRNNEDSDYKSNNRYRGNDDDNNDRRGKANPYALPPSDSRDNDKIDSDRYSGRENKYSSRQNEDSNCKWTGRSNERNQDYNDDSYGRSDRKEKFNPYALPPSDSRDNDKRDSDRYSGRENKYSSRQNEDSNCKWTGRSNERNQDYNDDSYGRSDRKEKFNPYALPPSDSRDNDKRDSDRYSGRENKYSSRQNEDSNCKWTGRSNYNDDSYGRSDRKEKFNPYALPPSDERDNEDQDTRNDNKYSGPFNDESSLGKSKYSSSSTDCYGNRDDGSRYNSRRDNDEFKKDRREVDRQSMESSRNSYGRDNDEPARNTWKSSQVSVTKDSFRDFDRLLVEFKPPKNLRLQHIILEIESRQIYEKMETILKSSSSKKIVVIIQRTHEFSDLTGKVLSGKGCSVKSLNEQNMDNIEHNEVQAFSTTFEFLADHPNVQLELPDVVINCDLAFKRVKFLERFLVSKSTDKKEVEIYHLGLSNSPFVHTLREIFE